MNKSLRMALLVTLPLLFGIGFWFVNSSNSSTITETEAIEIVKQKYPDYKDYPSDNLPPRSISTEKTDDGWYIAFIQMGSGRPFISATCFFVNNQKMVSSTKANNPILGENKTVEFSPRTCSLDL